MTGFIRGLFGGNGKKEAAQPPTPQDKEAYFLEPDDAKSFGNIDYMRTSKKVKRTFARKKGVSVEIESIKQISALESVRLKEDGTPEIKIVEANGSAPKQEQPSFNRRQADTSMDMFRNMAKDMKK
ncbi:MAG TPA: hypothetical protein V6D07_18450 [Trichocoleus sp.]